MLRERKQWLQWFLVEKKLKMMKAMDALSQNKREYERGIKNVETQNAEICSKIHEAQMELDNLRNTSRKETNAIKREMKVSKIKLETELKVKISHKIQGRFQFRWLKSKGTDVASPISMTLFSNHSK